MIDIKIKYVKKLEPYALNRSKEKYINEEIKEKKKIDRKYSNITKQKLKKKKENVQYFTFRR